MPSITLLGAVDDFCRFSLVDWAVKFRSHTTRGVAVSTELDSKRTLHLAIHAQLGKATQVRELARCRPRSKMPVHAGFLNVLSRVLTCQELLGDLGEF